MDKTAKERMKRYRGKKRNESVTETKSVTVDGVTVEMVPASYVEGLHGVMYKTLSERERFLTLSDGQVLDRLNQPEGNKLGFVEMMRCNESYNYKPSKKR